MERTKNIPDLYDILAHADAYSVKMFLKKYATRNLTMEVRLRANLIRETQVPKGVNKYGQVIGLLIRHNVHGTIRLTKRSVQLLAEVCQLFVDQQEELLVEGELRDAWDACEPVITQLHVFMDKYHGPDARLVEILVATYANLQALLQRDPAPELRDDIADTLLTLLDRNPHVIYDLDYNAIICMDYALPGDTEQEQVLEHIRRRVHDSGLLSHLQWKYWCAMLLKIPWSGSGVLKQVSEQHLYDVAHLINVSGDRMALRRLIGEFPSPASLPHAHLVQWSRWKFELAEQFSSIEEIRDAGLYLLALDPALNTYRKLRGTVSYDLLRERLPELAIPEILRADIFAHEFEWQDVLTSARKAVSPEILITYCEALAGHCADFEAATLEVATEFAMHYVGAQCTTTIDELLHTLAQNSNSEFAKTLLGTLQERFPGRFDQIKVSGRARKKRSESIF